MEFRYLMCKDKPRATLFDKIGFFFRGAVYSYKGLFAWLTPHVYIMTKIISPILQILFFTFLGRYYATDLDGTFFVIGNAVQISAINGIDGVAMTIAMERIEGTLQPLLGTPASRVRIFVSRSLMHIADGLLTVVVGFLFGFLFLGVSFENTNFALLLATILVTIFSTSGLGMLIGSFGLAARESNLLSNLTYFVLLIFSGINYPVTRLPVFMQHISYALPLTRGVQAVRAIIGGADMGSVAHLLWQELLVGAVYVILGFVLFKVLEYISKHKGTLDMY